MKPEPLEQSNTAELLVYKVVPSSPSKAPGMAHSKPSLALTITAYPPRHYVCQHETHQAEGESAALALLHWITEHGQLFGITLKQATLPANNQPEFDFSPSEPSGSSSD